MELGLVAFLIGIAVIFFGFYYWSTATFKYWENLGVPGPRPLPLLGNFARVFLFQQAWVDRQSNLYNKWKHEPFFGVFMARLPLLYVTDLEVAKNILVRDFHVFSGRGVEVSEKDDPLGGHLFNLDGHRWKVLRSKLSPIFTSGKLKHMVELMIECSEHYTTYLCNQVEKNNVIECREVAAKYTTDVIGSCAFGINMNALETENSKFRQVGKNIFAPTMYNMSLRFLQETAPMIYKFLGFTMATSADTKFFINIIMETMEYRKKNNIVRHDLVDILKDMKNNPKDIDFELSDALLTSQAFIFFIAGFESSSTIISFALYELALHPEIQEKLRAEIVQVLEKHNGQLSYDNINEMKYLNMVLKETMRKYPLAFGLRRVATQPYKIPGYNVTLPKGALVLIPGHLYQLDERFYPDPEVFDPQRFTEENINLRHSMAYLPFGDGPKNCIARRFAAYETKLGIIATIRNFIISPSHLTEIPYRVEKYSFFRAPVNGIHLKFEQIV